MIYVCNVEGLKKWDEPEQIKTILDDLEANKNRIVGLELCHNSIGEKCAKALGEKMKNLKNLKKLDLSDCFVSRGEDELPKCLKYLLEGVVDKKIKELRLSDNALGPKASEGYEFFFKQNRTLEKLYLNHCGMGPIGTPNLIKIIKENKDMPLKVLKYARNKMDDVGCESISELIKEKKTIQEIQISDNELTHAGLDTFFNAIKDNTNIKMIDIHNNTLGSYRKDLPEVIKSLSNIENLNISDLTIEDKDIILNIFKVLQGLNKLREFHFEYNISDIDFDNLDKNQYLSELFDFLLKVNKLKEIHLENNDIPKDIYSKYLPEFKKKGVYLFSCYSEEEEQEDMIDNEIDMKDLN